MAEPLVEIRGIKKHFYPGSGVVVKAVDGVSLSIVPGETLGLVGESGCGKSTLGSLVVGLDYPTDGNVLYRGVDVHYSSGDIKKSMRRDIQMIFQDPVTSLNPRMTVGEIIGEALDIHGLARGVNRKRRIDELLKAVGLSMVFAGRFPHQCSGGQRQRIGIARALAVNPRFIVCDEPLSALDVSIRAQMVNLLRDLRDVLQLTYLFMAHDLAILQHIADRIAVMYMGRIVELAPTRTLYTTPRHPYTKALLAAVPTPDPDARLDHQCLPESETASITPSTGCVFSMKCPLATTVCRETAPDLNETNSDHLVACRLDRLGAAAGKKLASL